MFSHVTLGTNDLEKAGLFYDALLEPLGLKRRKQSKADESYSWKEGDKNVPIFYIYSPYDGKRATCGNGTMVAFLAESPSKVDQTYEIGVKNGGVCDGPPGPRPHYGEGYYGAYLRDLDGNKIHIVYRGDFL